VKKTLLFATLAACAIASLSGCAGVAQVADGYATAAADGARAVEDRNLKVLAFGLCATPVSAVVRNPQVVPAIRSLCLPAGAGANPGALLDAVPPAPAKAADPGPVATAVQ
jgi:hypothetical protein